MFQRHESMNEQFKLPQKISRFFLKEITTSTGKVLSLLNTNNIDDIHQIIKQKQGSFKLSKYHAEDDSELHLSASVIADNKGLAYSIYPYEMAGIGQSKVKFVQDIDTFKWYVVKKFDYKPFNEVEMLKKNNMFVNYLEIEPPSKKSGCCSSLTYLMYQLGLIKGRCYIVQEMVDGNKLVELVEQIIYSTLSEKIKTAIAILQCVEKVHNKNIIHRDIKGNNLMYDNKKREWTLIDFGDAIALSKIPANGKMRDCPGTDGFDAPEVSPEFYERNGYTLPSFKSDIYTLGVVFEKYIFNDETDSVISSTLNRMKSKIPEFRPNIAYLIEHFQRHLQQLSNNLELKTGINFQVQQITSLKTNSSIFNKPSTRQLASQETELKTIMEELRL